MRHPRPWRGHGAILNGQRRQQSDINSVNQRNIHSESMYQRATYTYTQRTKKYTQRNIHGEPCESSRPVRRQYTSPHRRPADARGLRRPKGACARDACLSVSLSLSLSFYLSVYLSISLSLSTYMYIYIYIFVYVYIYIHIYTYIHYVSLSPSLSSPRARSRK